MSNNIFDVDCMANDSIRTTLTSMLHRMDQFYSVGLSAKAKHRVYIGKYQYTDIIIPDGVPRHRGGRK